MFTIRQYVRPATLEEAWKLNQKKANRIIGGMGWMKMTHGNVATAIDLCDLHLDTIEEKEDEFVLGAMVSLRQFETNQPLNDYFNHAPQESVRHIVGVQFRNCATLGGTVWLRPGFSDVITLLLALDCTVELYQGRQPVTDQETNPCTIEIPIQDFCKMDKDNSIITAIHIKKTGRKVSYVSFRNSETDFPVLAVALSKQNGIYTASIGARPGLAKCVEAENIPSLIEQAHQLSYQSNVRASAEYRNMLSEVLIQDALKNELFDDNLISETDIRQ